MPLLWRFEYLDGLEWKKRELIYLIRNNGVFIICQVIAEKAEGVWSEGREGKQAIPFPGSPLSYEFN